MSQQPTFEEILTQFPGLREHVASQLPQAESAPQPMAELLQTQAPENHRADLRTAFEHLSQSLRAQQPPSSATSGNPLTPSS